MTCQDSLMILTVIAMATVGCYGYGYGPPIGACAEMFPIEHYVNASTDTPPFEIVVNKSSYQPGDVIEILLKSKMGTKQADGRDWFYEGVMIQVRSQDCSNSMPVGRFTVKSDEAFLQPIDCLDLESSAIRHFDHAHVYNSTFYWTAPSTASGHVFVRATVARNRFIFWTNVFSPVISDMSDQTAPATMFPCRVRMHFTVPDACRNIPASDAAYFHVYNKILLPVTLLLLFA